MIRLPALGLQNQWKWSTTRIKLYFTSMAVISACFSGSTGCSQCGFSCLPVSILEEADIWLCSLQPANRANSQEVTGLLFSPSGPQMAPTTRKGWCLVVLPVACVWCSLQHIHLKMLVLFMLQKIRNGFHVCMHTAHITQTEGTGESNEWGKTESQLRFWNTIALWFIPTCLNDPKLLGIYNKFLPSWY